MSIKESASVPCYSDEIFTLIMPRLSLNTLVSFKNVNRRFYLLFNLIMQQETSNYHDSKLKGVEKKNQKKLYTFHSLLLDCEAHVKKFKYTPELKSLFGGVENILSLRTVSLKYKKDKFFVAINNFAQKPLFNALPSIFRMQYRVSKKKYRERIIIKYSMYIPKEAFKQPKQVDQVWHDYLDLYLMDNRLSEPEWLIADMRSRNSWPKEFRRSNPFPAKSEFVYKGSKLSAITKPLFNYMTKLTDEKLQAFIKGEMIKKHSVVLGHVGLEYFSTRKLL